MCGIAGYIGFKKIDEDKIVRTIDIMKNRGPNNQAWKVFKSGDLNICFLHSRLSIIDLDNRSNQPYVLGDYALIFNGEIYNYIEVRSQLKLKGHVFETESDTEVLLKAYIEYGDKCVDYFEGMWSFAIWDASIRRLFLSRDRFAEKPLYFVEYKDGIYFGSEIKFLKSLSSKNFPINKKHVLRNLLLGYKSLYKSDETFYSGIRELKYATNMFIGPDLVTNSYRFWTPQSKVNESLTLNEAIDGARHHLLESLKIRLRSDVPMAFCLSGGVDSASLASIAANHFGHEISTFSIIDDDERYNEYDNIVSTINDTGCNSNLVKLNYKNTLERLTDLTAYHDAPVATITFFVHSMLSEQISEAGFKVAFSGTSADELFTGYYDHFLLHLASVYGSSAYESTLSEWKEHILPFVRNPILQDHDLYLKDPNYRVHVFDNSTEFRGFSRVPFEENYTEENFTSNLLRNRMLNELFHEATPLILHEDDLNSMRFSIENRSPFLDTRLMEFAYSIPDKYLIKKGYGKFILREAVKGILNDKVRMDRQKKGFNASINSVFDFSDNNLREFILDDSSPIFDLVDLNFIDALLDINPQPNHYSKFLFSFITTKIFLEQNV